MTTLTQVAAGASPEVPANENFETLSAAGIYGKRGAATSGLTWAYFGGLYNGNTIADGTVTLTDSATNYVVVLRSTGVVSVSTSSTNSLDPLYAKLYTLTTSGGLVTNPTTADRRNDANGLWFASGVSGGDMILASVQTVTGAKTFGAAGAVGKLKIAGTTSGAATLDAPAVAGSIVVTLPSVTSTLATTADVAAAVAGLSWKQAVRAASTAALTLATGFENGDTIDGVTLATGDRILIKNQSSGSENGIYVVAASGAPARATDADSGAELVNASVYVSEGSTLADTQWTCTTNATITVGSTSLTFAQLSSGSVAIGSVTGLGTGVATALAVNIGTAGAPVVNGGALGTPSSGNLSSCTADGTNAVGFRHIPPNSQSAAYTAVLTDAGKSIDHPSTDANARTFTIPANASVAYPDGTAISFSNMASQAVTIAITSDTLYFAGTGTTGSRSLAQYGTATARKLTSTTWLISGVGLT